MRHLYPVLLAVALFVMASPPCAYGESQGSEYKGITDPFGDPSNYEFAEDEREDKEFFHLGRYLMLGVDIGAAIFTGGLGSTTQPSFYVGLKMLYFFDRSLAFEAAGHYSSHIDEVQPDANSIITLQTNVIPITLGFRYYFDTRNAPKAIAIANPFLVAGGGIYIKDTSVFDPGQGNLSNQAPVGTTNNFGGFGGGGVEFSIYRRHIYLGVDLRYHLVFFNDEESTFGGKLQPGERGGDYVTAAATLTYNF